MMKSKLSYLTLCLLFFSCSKAVAVEATVKATLDSANDINTATSINTQQQVQGVHTIGKGMEKAAIEKLAIEDAVKSAVEVNKVGEEFKVGEGISAQHVCQALTNKKTHVTKELATVAAIQDNLRQRTGSYGSKDFRTLRAERHARHLGLYCGQTEVKQGNCLFSPTGQPNQDVDFSNFLGTTAMTPAESEAAADFVKNIVDPARTVEETCTSSVCEDLRETEDQFFAIASGVQEQFLSIAARRSVADTPIRKIIFGKIQQNPELLSGDNWKLEDGTVNPETGEVTRGGVTGSSSGDVAPSADSLAKTANFIFVGDEIAEGYAKAAQAVAQDKVQSNTDSKAKPKEVLERLKKFKREEFKDKVVVLSTGVNQEIDNVIHIQEQLDYLRDTGATVIVLGVANNFEGSEQKGKAINDKLRRTVVTYGYSFNDGFTADAAKKTNLPTQYNLSDIKGLVL